jgi:hypothetical protein
MHFKPTIILELDGLVADYRGQFLPGFIPPPRSGIQDFLDDLINAKYSLILRSSRDMHVVQKWLEDNDLAFYFNGIHAGYPVAFATIGPREITFRDDFAAAFAEVARALRK